MASGQTTRGITILRGVVKEVADTAGRAERLGFQTAWTPEFYTRSAIVTLAAMGARTTSCRVGSSIAYADGFLGHPLFTADYFGGVVRPALVTGADKAGRAVDEVETVAIVICAVDDNEDRARREAAAQIAFYAAPSSYANVLDVAGFGAAGKAIRAAFRSGDHDAMVGAVTDAMIDRIAVAGTPEQVAERLARYDGTVDHVIVYPPSFRLSPARCRELADRLLTAAAPAP